MHNQEYLKAADKWLDKAIHWQCTEKSSFRWMKCLEKACVYELAGLGYCSLLPRFYERKLPVAYVDRAVAPPAANVMDDYIDFGNQKYKAASHAMH